MALRPTIVCLVYTIYDWPELQKHYTSKDTNVFYSDSKTDLKLWCNCIWNSSYLRVPEMFLVDWQLCVACYYPTTPTDYPSTSRGRSVGPPVTVNIDICGYLWFLSIKFVWIIWVCCSIPWHMPLKLLISNRHAFHLHFGLTFRHRASSV